MNTDPLFVLLALGAIVLVGGALLSARRFNKRNIRVILAAYDDLEPRQYNLLREGRHNPHIRQTGRKARTRRAKYGTGT